MTAIPPVGQQLPIADAITRLISNEALTDQWINGSTPYQPRDLAQPPVPTIPSFMASAAAQLATDTNTVKVLANQAGLYETYATYSAANSDVANVPSGKWVEVESDETITGTPTSRYQKVGSGLSNQTVFVRTSNLAVGTRTLSAKLDEFVEAKDRGGLGDGTTDDTAAIATTIALRSFLAEYKATGYANNRGIDVTPDGLVHNQATGRVYNPKQAQGYVSFGQETLQHWFGLFHGQAVLGGGNNQVTTKKITLSGDSTTQGSYSTSGYDPSTQLSNIAHQRGYESVVVTNSGQPGKSTNDWLNTHLAQDMATAIDLYVLRWGINDPFFGRSADQMLADYRTGLTQIRSSGSGNYNKPPSALSIVIMAPTTTNDVAHGRTEVYHERLDDGLRQLALDFDCAFIDTYGVMNNSHSAAGVWMDQPYPAGSATPYPNVAIHPFDEMYTHITMLLANVVMPEGFWHARVNGIYNKTAQIVANQRTPAMLPDTYPKGVEIASFSGTGTSTDGPQLGISITYGTPDGTYIQYVTGYNTVGDTALTTSSNGISCRIGYNNTWGRWMGQQFRIAGIYANGWNDSASAISAGSLEPGYYGMSLEREMFLSGNLSPGTVTNGTLIFTLPVGYRPFFTVQREVPVRNTLNPGAIGSGVNVLLNITPDGKVLIYGFPAGSGYSLNLNGVRFKIGN